MVSQAPTWIGEYQVFKELGRGGFGVVYLGRHPSIDRPVAIKVLLEGNEGNEAQRKRFELEARAVAKLNHPGIVRVHDMGFDRGRAFFVMEFVEGRSLKARVDREGPMEAREAAEAMLQICDAVQAAHTQGFLHRDLKPENVIETPEGLMKVTDFGLARELSEERERLTRTGAMIGTPGFMPPEQAAGELSRIEVRSDVYSLGATLFALVTGFAPFRGNAFEALAKVLREPAPKASSVQSSVPPEIDAICDRCLAKEFAPRYSSAAGLKADLQRYLAGEPLDRASRPSTRLTKALSLDELEGRARSLRYAALSLGLLVALALVAVSATLAVRSATATSPTPPIGASAELSLEVVAVDSSAGERLVVTGRTAPGARLKLTTPKGKRTARAKEDGSFRLTIEVGYGAGLAATLTARHEDRTAEVPVDLRPPYPTWFTKVPTRNRPPLPLRAGLRFATAEEYAAATKGLPPTTEPFTLVIWERTNTQLTYVPRPSGPFAMGFHLAVGSNTPKTSPQLDEKPAYWAHLSKGFYLGRLELSLLHLVRFRLAKGKADPADPLPDAKQVASGVLWTECAAYCAWAGLRMPTEAEWEHAAQGGTQDRFYPWGSGDPSPERARTRRGMRLGQRADVDSLPLGAARWGQLHMAGNVTEHVLDDYASTEYGWPVDEKFAVREGDGAEFLMDPCFQIGAAQKVARGGFLSTDTDHDARKVCRSAYRQRSFPDRPVEVAGFGLRVALDVEAP